MKKNIALLTGAAALVLTAASATAKEPVDGSNYDRPTGSYAFEPDRKTVRFWKDQTVNRDDFIVTLENGNWFFHVDGFPIINGTEEDFPPQQVWEALQKIGWGHVEKAKELGLKRPFDFYDNYREKSVAWLAKHYPYYKAPEPLPVSLGKLRNLAEKPTKPRFELTGKVWPATHGEASVCLWEDDKVAAFDFNQDDNNVTDQAGFREVAEKYGVKATFNIITFDIGGGYSGGGWKAPGTWDDWRKAKEDGFRIASHTHMHLQDWIKSDGWPGFEFEAAESKRLLDENLPDQNTRVYVYPGGGTPEMQYGFRYLLPTMHSVNMMRESATKYYAAARGGSVAPPINQANMIDYFNIATTQTPRADFNYDILLDPTLGNKFYRGWLNIFIHGLLLDRWESDPAHMGYTKFFEWINAHRDDLWIGFMEDIALYSQERDTATLTTVSADDKKIVLHLTSQMEPTIFDYPLTVKVRLADTWKGATAMQDDKPVECKTITHENTNCALVKARPDRGEIVLAPAKK